MKNQNEKIQTSAERLRGELQFALSDPEMAGDAELIAMINAELEIAESVEAQTAKIVELARRAPRVGKKAVTGFEAATEKPSRAIETIDETTAILSLTPEAIGWLDGDTDIKLDKVTLSGNTFWFGSTLEESRETSIGNRFNTREIEIGASQIKTHIAQLMSNPLNNGGSNSLERLGKDRITSESTELETWKDRGLTCGRNENNVRALVLMDRTTAEEPVFLMASLADGHQMHGGQQALIYELPDRA